MSDLQKLVVRLEAETAKYQRDLDSARKQLGSYEKAAVSAQQVTSNLGKAIAGYISAATLARLGSYTKQTLDYADSVDEAASALGVSTTFYQKAAYALSQTGLNQDKFTASFSKFVQLAESFSNGEKGATDIFSKLGIDATHAQDNVEALFDLVAEQLDKLPNQEKRLASIADLFGKKSATPYAAALADGAEQFRAMGDQAERLGRILSEKDLATLGTLGDAIDTIGGKFQVAFAQGLAEGLTGQTGELRDILTDPAFAAATDTIAEGIKSIGVEVGKLPDLLAQLEEHRDIIQIFAAFAAGAYLFKGKGMLAMGAGGLGGAAIEVARQGIWPVEKPSASPKAPALAPVDAGMPMLPGVEQSLIPPGFQDEVNTAAAAITNASTATKDFAGSQKEAKVATEETTKATDGQREAFDPLVSLYREYESVITGVDESQLRYNDSLQDLGQLLQAGKISAEQFGAAADRLHDQMEGIQSASELWGQATERIKGATSGLFQSMITDGANWKENLSRFFEQIAASYAQMAADMLTQQLFAGGSGGGGGGINWGSLIGGLVGAVLGGASGGGSVPTGGGSATLPDTYSQPPLRAAGGLLAANTPTVVGERGPELVISSRAQVVLNALQTRQALGILDGGGGARVVNNWTFNTPDADSFRRSRRQIVTRENAMLRMAR